MYFFHSILSFFVFSSRIWGKKVFLKKLWTSNLLPWTFFPNCHKFLLNINQLFSEDNFKSFCLGSIFHFYPFNMNLYKCSILLTRSEMTDASAVCVMWKFQTFFNWHHFRYLAQQWTAWRITSFSSRMPKILLKVSKIWIILNCGNTLGGWVGEERKQWLIYYNFCENQHKNCI